MGNRTFMHWVGQLHAGGQAGATREIAAQGLQGPGRPLTHLDTLQRAFGHHDIRGMREHTGAVAGSALDAMDAQGYTRGGRMALAGAPGTCTPRPTRRRTGCNRRHWGRRWRYRAVSAWRETAMSDRRMRWRRRC